MGARKDGRRFGLSAQKRAKAVSLFNEMKRVRSVSRVTFQEHYPEMDPMMPLERHLYDTVLPRAFGAEIQPSIFEKSATRFMVSRIEASKRRRLTRSSASSALTVTLSKNGSIA